MTHDVRQYRRSRFPWRTSVALAIVSLVIGLRCSSSFEGAALDVTHLLATSGTFPLMHITEAGLLEIKLEQKQLAANIKPQAGVVQVQLLGIEIEETEEAVAFLRSRLASATEVQLRFDRRRISANARVLLAYAYYQGKCLNVELVQRGLATDATHPADAGPMIRQIKKAEQLAEAQQLGVWSK